MERNRHLTNLINYKVPTLLLIAPAALVMELDVVLAVKSGWGEAKMKSWMHFFKPSTWVFIARRRSVVRGVRVGHRPTNASAHGRSNRQSGGQQSSTDQVGQSSLQIYFWILKLIVRW